MTWFGGVSRFQFSYTDCPECNGFGFLEQTADRSLQAVHLKNTSNLSTEQTHAFLKTLAHILSKTLVQGETIRLRGFGSFRCNSSKSESKTKISFSPAKQLLKTLNK
jgi:excinuclease UvrABC ATPase subunit